MPCDLADLFATLTDGQSKLLIGGTGTVVAGATWGAWSLANRAISFWKDAYEAKDKELGAAHVEMQNLRKNTLDYSKQLVDVYQSALNAQIDTLNKEIEDLKAKAQEDIAKLKRLLEKADHDDAEITFLRGEREYLERKIAAYEEMVNPLMARRSKNSMILQSLGTDSFDPDELSASVEREIRRRFAGLKPPARPPSAAEAQAAALAAATTKAWTAANIKAEASKTRQMRQKLQDLADRERSEQARAQKHMHEPFGPPPGTIVPDKKSR